MMFTLGLLVRESDKVVICLVIPLGLSNLDDNMWVQYTAFGLSIALIGQWVSAAFINGLQVERIRISDPIGLSFGQVLGTIMLNLAITVIIPSWINIKVESFNTEQRCKCSKNSMVLYRSNCFLLSRSWNYFSNGIYN
jgi:ABC-type amino acid transport system permease subunit